MDSDSNQTIVNTDENSLPSIVTEEWFDETLIEDDVPKNEYDNVNLIEH